jgi:hypothetical protein
MIGKALPRTVERLDVLLLQRLLRYKPHVWLLLRRGQIPSALFLELPPLMEGAPGLGPHVQSQLVVVSTKI